MKRAQPLASVLVRPLKLAALVGLLTACSAGERVVRCNAQGETIDLTIGGEPFATYNFGHSLPRPFFLPVRGPGGGIVTRPLEGSEDHPHHKGIWVAIDEVNGVRFWAEQGKIENVSARVLSEGSPARLRVINHWLGSDGKPIVTETTVMSIFANRLLAYDITFTAERDAVTFADTKEGLFGIRLRNSMREKNGGQVINADGVEGASQCWGRTSKWVDCHGSVDGEILGVALFDHPGNFRKARYHVRDYGLLAMSPFGEAAYTRGKVGPQPLELLAGGSVRLRYGIYLHTGDAISGHVEGAYQQFLDVFE